MYEHVSHRHDLWPWKEGMLIVKFAAKLPRCFTNDLQMMDDPCLNQFFFLKGGPAF
jgi:hypothetical protein